MQSSSINNNNRS